MEELIFPINRFFKLFIFQWNQLYWNNSEFTAAEFESLIIMSMTKPDNISYSGVVITALIQFALEMTLDDYLETWNSLTDNDKNLIDWKIAGSNITSKPKF